MVTGLCIGAHPPPRVYITPGPLAPDLSQALVQEARVSITEAPEADFRITVRETPKQYILEIRDTRNLPLLRRAIDRNRGRSAVIWWMTATVSSNLKKTPNPTFLPFEPLPAPVAPPPTVLEKKPAIVRTLPVSPVAQVQTASVAQMTVSSTEAMPLPEVYADSDVVEPRPPPPLEKTTDLTVSAAKTNPVPVVDDLIEDDTPFIVGLVETEPALIVDDLTDEIVPLPSVQIFETKPVPIVDGIDETDPLLVIETDPVPIVDDGINETPPIPRISRRAPPPLLRAQPLVASPIEPPNPGLIVDSNVVLSLVDGDIPVVDPTIVDEDGEFWAVVDGPLVFLVPVVDFDGRPPPVVDTEGTRVPVVDDTPSSIVPLVDGGLTFFDGIRRTRKRMGAKGMEPR